MVLRWPYFNADLTALIHGRMKYLFRLRTISPDLNCNSCAAAAERGFTYKIPFLTPDNDQYLEK